MKPTVTFLSLVFLSIPVLTAVSKNGDSPLLKGGLSRPGTTGDESKAVRSGCHLHRCP